MIAVAVALLVALLCLSFILFAFWGLMRRPVERPVPRYYQTLAERAAGRIEELDLIFFQNRDYDLLSARRELRSVRAKLWRERRKIALLCLADVQNDADVLWRFRRFLVRNGLPVTFQDEAGILVAFLLLLSCLLISRSSVFFCGPFFSLRVIRATAVANERFSHRCDRLVSRMPREKRLELEQKWSQEIPATAACL